MKAFPWLEDGERAVDERSQPKFGRFDGHVPRAERHDPRRTGRAVSASYLELLAGCPYHFFLEKLLRIEALEEEEADEDVWLPPKVKGSELHAFYAEMLRLLRSERRGIDLACDAEWLRGRATARLDALRVEMPPPSDAVFEREKAGILGDVQRFVEWEATRGDRTPVALEVDFGMDDVDPTVEPLARTEPVPIPLGRGERLHVRGRIDRIDRLGEGTYEVVDYKTGYFAPEAWAGVFNGGRRLQHAVYGLAARELLRAIDHRAKVEAGSYYFTGERGGGERVRIAAPSAAALGRVLNGLLDTLAAGAFLHTANEGDCRYCKLGRACLKDHARATMKMQNGDVPLASFADVRSHD
jgi:ATP-dependent helicase/nuclease subunit B